MEQLARFVMDNFFIVVVAVGIIYSLFFRKSPLEKPRNRMPDFGGGQGQRRPPGAPPQRGVPMRPRPEPAQASRPTPRPPAAPEPERTLPSTPDPYEPAIAEPRRDAAPRPVPAAASRVAPTASGTASPRGDVPTREELERAVVWAEILGPPRARRPHGR